MNNNNPYIKNLPHSKIFDLADEVSYLDGQIVSKTLSQNSYVSLTLFAFAKGEEISTHASSGDAMITSLDGEGEIIIDGERFVLSLGQTIVMPANKPHAVKALTPFKMLLTVIFPLTR